MSREPYFPHKRLRAAVMNDDTFTAKRIYQNCRHSWRTSIGLRDYCKTAIGHRCLPMLKLLLSQDGFSRWSSASYNPLMKLAVESDFTEGVEFLQSKGWLLNKDSIYKCLKNNKPGVLKYILEHKILLLSEQIIKSTPTSNKQLKHVETCALHYCIRGMKLDKVRDCVKLLVEAGADINRCDYKGRTALMKAARSCNRSVLQCLLDAGADANLSDNNGRTALMVAARACNRSVLQCLLEAGADVNLSDKYGRTALMVAARACDRSGIQCLLDAGADVNKTDTYGNFAIHNVMFGSRHIYNRKWINCLKLLLINKCYRSLDSPGENGKTLLNWLLDKQETDLIWYLVTENCSLKGLILGGFRDKFEFQDTLMLSKILFESGASNRQIDCVILKSRHIVSATRAFSGPRGSEVKNQLNEFRGFCKSRSLESRCRKVIRKCIGSGIRSKITQLSLPPLLQDYVIMKDLIPEKYFILVMKDTDDH